MEPLRVGIVGCGYWGPNLIRNFVELPSADVVAVADMQADRLAHVQSRYPGIWVTRDYRDLFEMNLHAMVVATPPATHFRIARDCLSHGLHVLVEKPLALNSQDAEGLIETAESQGLTLMVGHTFEYNAAVRVLKDLVQSGELGEIFYVDVVRVNLGLFQRDLNVIWDLAPHDVSILRYVLGHEPSTITAQGADCLIKGKHDVAYLNMQFPDGILAHIRISWLDPRKVRRITVVGSEKMVVYDDVETLEKIKIYDKGVECPPYTDSYGDFQCSYRFGDVVIPNIRFTEPLRVECEHFVECIVDHNRPQSCGRVGLKVVKVLEAAERSLQNGGMPETLSWDMEEPSHAPHERPQRKMGDVRQDKPVTAGQALELVAEREPGNEPTAT